MNPPTLHLGSRIAGAQPFRLPLSIVTATIAILARKGRGKTYTAAVLAEELLEAGQVPVIIDPTGAHWGLKSSADGQKAGYPVVVFGGEHADLPLEEHAGETVARAIVEQRFPAIIDLSLLRKGASHRFLAAFLETLYRLNREPVHLLADEADDYAPQKPFGDEARVLGAMEDIVRRGRIKGIGCTMITQRPAVLNKNVLTQADMLIALGMNHPRDIDAIEEWVAVHGDVQQAAKMIASLPGLAVGSAWFWAPALDDLFEQVKIRSRRTFDSSATPKAGEKIVAPKRLAEIDVARLGKEIAETVQRAKENDPKELKAEVARLKAELAKKPVATAAERVEVKVPDREALMKLTDRLDEVNASIAAIREPLQAQLDRLERIRTDIGHTTTVITRELTQRTAAPVPVRAPRPIVAPAPARTGQPDRPGGSPEIGTGGKRRILTALAQNPDGMGTRRLSLLTGISASGGTWRTYLGELRSAGYVDGGGEHMTITQTGTNALGSYTPLPTGEALREYWRQRLGDSGKRRIFDAVVDAYPRAASYDEVSRATGIATDGGTWRTYLGELRGLELIEGRGELRACSDLFD